MEEFTMDNDMIYENFLRFQADLEFLQMLANPKYLHCFPLIMNLLKKF